MILRVSMRTDIPAFYSEWFFRRLQAGSVCVRNPRAPRQVTRYRLSPQVVDLFVFCTKNPAPMLERLSELSGYGQYWFVTLTPYGREIEPYVPDKAQVLKDFLRLSQALGPTGWLGGTTLFFSLPAILWNGTSPRFPTWPKFWRAPPTRPSSAFWTYIKRSAGIFPKLRRSAGRTGWFWAGSWQP